MNKPKFFSHPTDLRAQHRDSTKTLAPSGLISTNNDDEFAFILFDKSNMDEPTFFHCESFYDATWNDPCLPDELKEMQKYICFGVGRHDLTKHFLLFYTEKSQTFDTDGWDIFYKHATFKEIFTIPNHCPGAEVLKRLRTMERGEGNQDELTLEIIRDMPSLLNHDDFLSKLKDILHTAARWGKKVNRDRAKNLLNNFLIPKQRKAPTPPQLGVIKELTKALADYLSQKCKDALKSFGNGRHGLELQKSDNGERLLGKEEEEYEYLKNWARENSEFRISRLSLNDLSSLIFRPHTYADDLLMGHFDVSSKTMRRRKPPTS